MHQILLVSGTATINKQGGGTATLYRGTVLSVDDWEPRVELDGVWETFTALRAASINPPAGKASFVLVSRAGGVRQADGTPFICGPGSIIITDVGVSLPLSVGAWLSVPFV